jgi:hypothetical protein
MRYGDARKHIAATGVEIRAEVNREKRSARLWLSRLSGLEGYQLRETLRIDARRKLRAKVY